MTVFGAIEAGGTKFVCAVGDSEQLREVISIPTREPGQTLADVCDFFDAAIARQGPIESIGIGSFGPLQLSRALPGYGQIASTPKPGWQGVDMPDHFARRYAIPVAIDTDVNAAAIAEAKAMKCERIAYVTVGTGIGVGLVLDGAPQSGFGHPEIGHMHIRKHAELGDFPGVCPFHRDCLEGVASGPAILARWGGTLVDLPPDHIAWEVEATHLGELAATLILAIAPERVVFGGGVMKQQRLFKAIRRATAESLGGYLTQWDETALDTRIVPPACKSPSGLVGSFMLAERVYSLGNNR